MKYEEALKEIEETLDQLDVATLYESCLGHEIHAIIRRLRTKKSDEFAKIVRGL